MKKNKTPDWVFDYYNLLERTRHGNVKGFFLPDDARYRPLKAALNGSKTAFDFAQEELRKLFPDLPNYEN